ncbi:hypothetical protein [Rhizobium sp. SG_E_25_P2]|uniref:hypothetical protein n=1 Tax=Rhizobium sp. SG_E_25_P2 TaxID=2879942 RepID=UPI002473F6FA|nr:hypothetical protein [Rhizobium sp. SG_E_25_P2]
MSSFPVSSALLRTLPRLAQRAAPDDVRRFASGQGTKPATLAHERQQAGASAAKVIKAAAKAKPTPEEKRKAIERRRRWGGGGSMPPDVRDHYSEGERAALAVIAEECKRKTYCDKCLDEIARIAGVCRTTVQNALRKAREKGRQHLLVTERPQRGKARNLTNIIRVISKTWLNWMARAIGFKRLSTSRTGVKSLLSEGVEPLLSALERERAETARPSPHPLRVSESDKGRRPSLSERRGPPLAEARRC